MPYEMIFARGGTYFAPTSSPFSDHAISPLRLFKAVLRALLSPGGLPF